MNIKEAVEVLKTTTKTPEEKLALALLVCELDNQFCYGWGAGCSATGEEVFETQFSEEEDVEYKNREVGELVMRVAGSPKLENWRQSDFPQIEEFSKIVQDQHKDEIPF